MSNKDNKKYNIVKDRIEIYLDFSINLSYYIMYYYLDPITLNDDNDIKNHFDFCFNKVCDEFLEEEIDFRDNKNLREYFHTYFYTQLYKTKNQPTIELFEKFWRTIFNIKNKNYLNVFIEIFLIFDKSIEQTKKSILEFV